MVKASDIFNLINDLNITLKQCRFDLTDYSDFVVENGLVKYYLKFPFFKALVHKEIIRLEEREDSSTIYLNESNHKAVSFLRDTALAYYTKTSPLGINFALYGGMLFYKDDVNDERIGRFIVNPEDFNEEFEPVEKVDYRSLKSALRAYENIYTCIMFPFMFKYVYFDLDLEGSMKILSGEMDHEELISQFMDKRKNIIMKWISWVEAANIPIYFRI